MSGYQGRPEFGFLLPSILDNGERACVTFNIPNQAEYRQAVIGHLYELSKWYVWEKTFKGDTRARDTAELFRNLLMDTLVIDEDCEGDVLFRLRQNPDNTCQLEQSLDGGVSWQLAFDYSLCRNPDIPPLIRFTDNGDMEVSYDGGETYTPATTEDPRKTASLIPPLNMPDGDNKRCQLAVDIRDAFKSEVDKLIADSAAWGSVSGLAAVLVGILITIGIIGTGGALTPLLLTIAAGLLTTGSAAFAAAFTSEVWDKFTCIVYCNTKPDGTIDEAGMAAIKLEIDFQIGGIAGDHLVNMLTLTGVTGLNNAGRTISTSNPVCNCTCPLCSEWHVYFVYWNHDVWTVGEKWRYAQGTPVGQYDSRISVGGRLEIQLPVRRPLRQIQFRHGNSTAGGWTSSQIHLYLDGIDIGVPTGNTGNPARPYWNIAQYGHLQAQTLTFDGFEVQKNGQTAALEIRMEICGEPFTIPTIP